MQKRVLSLETLLRHIGSWLDFKGLAYRAYSLVYWQIYFKWQQNLILLVWEIIRTKFHDRYQQNAHRNNHSKLSCPFSGQIQFKWPISYNFIRVVSNISCNFIRVWMVWLISYNFIYELFWISHEFRIILYEFYRIILQVSNNFIRVWLIWLISYNFIRIRLSSAKFLKSNQKVIRTIILSS